MGFLITILLLAIRSVVSLAQPTQAPTIPFPTPLIISPTPIPTLIPSPIPTSKPTNKPRPSATPTDDQAHRPNPPTICVENCGPSFTPQANDIYTLTGPKGNLKIILHPQENCTDKNKVIELHALYPHMNIFENNTKNMIYQTIQGTETVFTGLYPGQYSVVVKYCGGRQTPKYGGSPEPDQTYVTEINLP